MASFDERIGDLQHQVGDGRLVGALEVDQRYARYQHEELQLRHTAGRTAKYLERPLLANTTKYMRTLAGAVLDGDLGKAMADNMEHLSGEVERVAPIDENDLPRSGHPVVTSGGRVVYDRAPQVARLTEEQLKAKAERRGRRGGL